MTILLFDNSSRFLSDLQTLLGKYGDVTTTSDSDIFDSPNFDLVVLSGGYKYSITRQPDHFKKQQEFIKTTSTPTIGICLGAQLIAYTFGGTLERLPTPQKGLVTIQILQPDGIFQGKLTFDAYESHKWGITRLPPELIGLAKSPACFEVIKHRSRPIYGFQFHPEEFVDDSFGDEVFDAVIKSCL